MFSTKILEAEITDVTKGYHYFIHDDIVGERITETRDDRDQLVSRSSSLITKSRAEKFMIDEAWVEVGGNHFDIFRMISSPRPGEEVFVFEHWIAGRKSADLFHRRTARIIFHGATPFGVGSRKPYLIVAALIFIVSYLYSQKPMITLGAAVAAFIGCRAFAYLRFLTARLILGTMRIRARRKVLYGG